jgi:hypothetical protein
MVETDFLWEGHSIQIDTRPALKYLWMATETVVNVDGVEIGRIGGFRFTEKMSGEFIHNNNPCQLVLDIKVDLITLVSVPYQLSVDGGIISRGRLRIEDWPLFLVPLAILTVGLCIFAALIILF